MIDLYPGARPFADDPNDQRLFYGRDEEIDTLFHRVCVARLLVLFGKSGLGKTSFLHFYSVYDLIGPLLIELNQFDKGVEISQHTIARALKQGDRQANKRDLTNLYNNLAWLELFRGKPKNAIEASEQGLNLNVDELMNTQLNINRAHGYLFSDQYQKAKELYLIHKDKKNPDGRIFKQAVLDDFKEFRKHGINHPDMKKIEKLLH